jgi:hypothetical protein
MAYQQITIIVTLTSHLLILVYYLANLFRMYQGGGLVESDVFRLWWIVIIATIVITVVGIILTTIMISIARAIKTGTVEEERFIVDERDNLIDLKGERVSYVFYSIGVFLSMLTFVLNQPALVMFSLLILSGILGGVAGNIAKLYLYRRGV